jgi:ribosomal protein L37AE/L43A
VKRVPFKECVQCNANMIAPTRSEHLSEHCIRNVWSCEACGYQFEDTIYLYAQELADAD